MGWMYMIVCIMDFVVFPILWSLLQAVSHGRVETQWNPITLQGAGLFHIAMGAVLGVAAFGRTQEKLAGANNVGTNISSSGITTFSTPPAGNGYSSSSISNSFGGSSAGSTPSSTPTRSVDGDTRFGEAASGPIAITASGKKVVPPNNDPVI